MSAIPFGQIGVKGAQVLPARTITPANVVEAVQMLYDLLGGEKLGRENQTAAWLCGIKFTQAN